MSIARDLAKLAADASADGAVAVGTSANDLVQLDATAKLPAVDGSQLTNLPSGATTLAELSDVDLTGLAAGQRLEFNGTSFVAVTPAPATADTGDIASFFNGVGDGTTTVFNIVHDQDRVMVYQNGILQVGGGEDFTSDGAANTVTFTVAPLAVDQIQLIGFSAV